MMLKIVSAAAAVTVASGMSLDDLNNGNVDVEDIDVEGVTEDIDVEEIVDNIDVENIKEDIEEIDVDDIKDNIEDIKEDVKGAVEGNEDLLEDVLDGGVTELSESEQAKELVKTLEDIKNIEDPTALFDSTFCAWVPAAESYFGSDICTFPSEAYTLTGKGAENADECALITRLEANLEQREKTCTRTVYSGPLDDSLTCVYDQNSKMCLSNYMSEYNATPEAVEHKSCLLAGTSQVECESMENCRWGSSQQGLGVCSGATYLEKVANCAQYTTAESCVGSGFEKIVGESAAPAVKASLLFATVLAGSFLL